LTAFTESLILPKTSALEGFNYRIRILSLAHRTATGNEGRVQPER
jgi:hypothetical protein